MEKFNNIEDQKNGSSVLEKPANEMTLEEARSAVEILKEKYSNVKKLYNRVVKIGLTLLALAGASGYVHNEDSKHSLDKQIGVINDNLRDAVLYGERSKDDMNNDNAAGSEQLLINVEGKIFIAETNLQKLRDMMGIDTTKLSPDKYDDLEYN